MVLQKDADNTMRQKYKQRRRFREYESKRVTYIYHQEEPDGISAIRNGEGDFENVILARQFEIMRDIENNT